MDSAGLQSRNSDHSQVRNRREEPKSSGRCSRGVAVSMVTRTEGRDNVKALPGCFISDIFRFFHAVVQTDAHWFCIDLRQCLTSLLFVFLCPYLSGFAAQIKVQTCLFVVVVVFNLLNLFTVVENKSQIVAESGGCWIDGMKGAL